MKCKKSKILLAIGGLFLSLFFPPDSIAQMRSKHLSTPSARIIGCNNDHTDCFIKAAENCRRVYIHTISTDNPKQGLPHPYYDQEMFYEIRGLKNGKCIFFAKNELSRVFYSEDFIQFAMKDRNKTRQEAKQELAEEKLEYDQTTGQSGLCSFQTEKLVNMLKTWWPKGGGSGFSTKDFDGANCQGTLYNFAFPVRTMRLPDPNAAKP